MQCYWDRFEIFVGVQERSLVDEKLEALKGSASEDPSFKAIQSMDFADVMKATWATDKEIWRQR